MRQRLDNATSLIPGDKHKQNKTHDPFGQNGLLVFLNRLIPSFFFLLFFIPTLVGQAESFEWIHTAGSYLSDESGSISTDINGNIYVTGTYRDTVDFDPGIGNLPIASNGSRDIFIQKFNPKGELIWVKTIGGEFWDVGLAIHANATGYIFLTGKYQGYADFDPGPDTSFLYSNGGDDVFVLKLDPDGYLLWARSFGGPHFDYGLSIDTDIEGNVYCAGYFQGTVDFDGERGIYELSSNGLSDGYILKLDPSGHFLWARAIGGKASDQVRCVRTDLEGQVYVTGYFRDTVDFDPSPSSFKLASNGDDEIFVLKLNPRGEFSWAISAGGKNWDAGSSLSTDADGNLYVTGYFIDTIDIDPGPKTRNMASNGGWDIFLLKLNRNGKFEWAESFGGLDDDDGIAISIDPKGNIFLVGRFEDQVDFDPGPNSKIVQSQGSSDLFILKLSPYREFLWVQTLGGPEYDFANSICHGPEGQLYFTGQFKKTAKASWNTNGAPLVSKGDWDIVIAALNSSMMAVDLLENTMDQQITFNNNSNAGIIVLEFSEAVGNFQMILSDEFGKKIDTWKYSNTNQVHLDLSQSPGSYTLEIVVSKEKRALISVDYR